MSVYYETQESPKEMCKAFYTAMENELGLDYELNEIDAEGDLWTVMVLDLEGTEEVNFCDKLESRLEIFYKCTG